MIVHDTAKKDNFVVTQLKKEIERERMQAMKALGLTDEEIEELDTVADNWLIKSVKKMKKRIANVLGGIDNDNDS